MKLRHFACFAIMLFASATAGAQSKWSYQFSLGGTLNSGNIDNKGFKTNASVERNDSVLAFDANVRYLYTEEKGEVTNHGLGSGIKFDIHQYDRWSPFFAAEQITNHFKGYDFKMSFLFGVKWRIYTLPGKCDYSISGAIVGDYVDYHITDPEADDRIDKLMRVSLRGKIKQRFGENTSLVHTTFWQPSVKDFSDYIVTSVTKIENKLHENVFFDLIFEYEYRSFVPEGRKNQDVSTEVAIRLKF